MDTEFKWIATIVCIFLLTVLGLLGLGEARNKAMLQECRQTFKERPATEILAICRTSQT